MVKVLNQLLQNWMASKRSQVIAIIGDGSMQMNIQELENIKSHNLPIKIFVINNNGYGMIKQTMNTWMKGKYVGCDLKSGLSLPDFKRVSNAYGIHSTTLQPELATTIGVDGGRELNGLRQRPVKTASCQISCGSLCEDLTCCG